MTVRDFIQSIISNAPDMDAEVYIQSRTVDSDGDVDYIDHDIDMITNDGTDDGLFIIV